MPKRPGRFSAACMLATERNVCLCVFYFYEKSRIEGFSDLVNSFCLGISGGGSYWDPQVGFVGCGLENERK